MRHLFFILFISLVHMTWAQNLTFKASAPASVVQGEQFQIEYTLNSAEGTALRPPGFDGLSVLFGPATSISQSSNYDNGKYTTQSATTYTYTVVAEKSGTINVSPATVKSGRQQLTSNALVIKVVPPDKTQNKSRQGGNVASSGVDIFTRIQLSKTKVYEQEAILASLKLYTTTGNLSPNKVENPTFEGFIVQEIKLDNVSLDNIEQINGKNYSTAIFAQWLLFPQKTGKLTVNSGKYNFIVSVPRNVNYRGFGSGVVYQEMQKNTVTPPVSVDVMPLPSGRPASYYGGVGTFGITSSINKTDLKTNDALTIKVVIKGTGNVKYIKDPEIVFPKDFEIYDPKSTVAVKETSRGMSGTKTIEYTAVPRYPGKYKIPGVVFSYFDVAAKSYKTLKTEDYEINVEKGSSTSSSATVNFADKEAVRLLNKDIRYINTDNHMTLKKDRTIYWGSLLYWFCYLLPLLAFIVFVIITRKQAKENANLALMRNKKANKVATKRLKIANKYLLEHNKALFYAEIMKALWGYLSDKLTIPVSQLNRDNVVAIMEKYGASEELISEFMKIIDTCEFAQYAPVQSDEAMDNLYGDTVSAIGKMENTIKK